MKIKLLQMCAFGAMAFLCLSPASVEAKKRSDLSFAFAASQAPVAANATNIMNTTFGAQWAGVSGATSYRLDVSRTPFGQPGDAEYVYQNLFVENVTYYTVTGLNPATPYYYRVRAIDADGASPNSNTISVFTTDVTTWDGIGWSDTPPTASINAFISGAYDTANNGSFTSKSLTVNTGGSLVARAGTNMTVVNTIVNEAGVASLTIESNANLLQIANNNLNSGDITVNRNASMRRLDYVYWSAPVTGQNLQDFSQQTLSNRFYTISEPANGFTVVNPSTNDFTLCKGFVIRAPDDFPTAPQEFNGIFTGVPNNGDLMIPVTLDGQGYNLIGNPYPSTLSASSLLNANPEISTIYLWTHTVQGSTPGANYATINATGETSASSTTPESETPNGIIQVGQGFVAKVNAPGNAIFKNTMRIANNQDQFFRTSAADRDRLWLNVTSQGGGYSQMLIGYVEGATDMVDNQFDAPQLDSEGTRLYSIIDGETPYVIQGKSSPFNNSDTVKLGFVANQAGNYTLALDHMEGIFSEGQAVFLKDNETGSVTNLATGAYQFISAAGNFADRFSIQYLMATLGTGTPQAVTNDILVFKKNNRLQIMSSAAVISEVSVYDTSGRLLYYTNQEDSTSLNVPDVRAAGSLLLVRVTTADGSISTRKVIF
ncbi:fibronectin type III domain-containing protein [Flavobacterium pallidum]|nr:fibronectin type III domain-containing protein [Flavobacterium pallidum]